jgi:Skp family chaperone for outer membrane proteins
MRGSAIVASLVLSLALSAAPVFAQAAGQAKPAQPPAPTPAPAAPPAAAPGPPAPFPQGAKIAFFNPQVVFQASADGKAALARVNNLIQKKQKEAEDKAKMLQGNQQKLQTSGSVMNEAARSQLEKEIEKQQKDGERFQQDAQAEVQELQQEVQNEFVKKLSPIVNELATEKGLHIVFNAGEAGIAWAVAGLDLTGDVIKKLDAQAKPATTPKE